MTPLFPQTCFPFCVPSVLQGVTTVLRCPELTLFVFPNADSLPLSSLLSPLEGSGEPSDWPLVASPAPGSTLHSREPVPICACDPHCSGLGSFLPETAAANPFPPAHVPFAAPQHGILPHQATTDTYLCRKAPAHPSGHLTCSPPLAAFCGPMFTFPPPNQLPHCLCLQDFPCAHDGTLFVCMAVPRSSLGFYVLEGRS